MTLPLINKPIAFLDESPGSLLIRISEFNGWQSPSSLLIAQNYQYSNNSTVDIESIMCNQKKWNKVLKSFGITSASARETCYNRLDLAHNGKVNFLGVSIPWAMLRLHDPAVCPKCLKENHYHRNLWDLKLITSCSKHNVKLIKSCPVCGKKIRWNRKYLTKCKCGKKFENISATQCKSEVSKQLENLIENNDTKTLNLVFKLHSAYEDFYNFISKPIDQHDLVKLCFNSLHTPNKTKKLLTQTLAEVAKTKGIHPRLALHPFLSSNSPEIKRFAEDALNLHHYRKPKRNLIEGNIGFTSTSRILGISPHRAKTLIHYKLLEKYEADNPKPNSSLLVTLESINNLLTTCSKDTIKNKPSSSFKSIKELTNTFQYCHTFIELMQEIVSGKREYSGYKVPAKGLKGISIKPSTKERTVAPKETLTIKETAELCDVNYENIRFAIHSGILKRISSKETKGTTIYINKNDAYEFHRRYVFSGSLAKQFGFNSTNLAEKIFTTGVKAISGPSIDGGLVYLFRRMDINTLDMKRVNEISGYPTNAGRKKGNYSPSEDSNSISLSKASKYLNISVQKASQLLRDGFIVEHSCLTRERRVTLQSIKHILTIEKNNSLIPISEAAQSTKESIQQFRMRWLQTKFIDFINTGLDSYISKDDLVRIKDFKHQNILARDVRKLTGINESKIRAFKNSNIIKLSRKIGKGRNKVIFYDKKEIMCVCHMR